MRKLELDLIAKLPPKPQRSPSAEYNDLLSRIQCANKALESDKEFLMDTDERIETLQEKRRELMEKIGTRQVDIAKLEADRAALQHPAAPSAAAASCLPPVLAGANPEFLEQPEIINFVAQWRELPGILAKFQLDATAAAEAAKTAEPAPPGNQAADAPDAPNSGSSGNSGGGAPAEEPSDDAQMGEPEPTTIEEAAAFAERF